MINSVQLSEVNKFCFLNHLLQKFYICRIHKVHTLHIKEKKKIELPRNAFNFSKIVFSSY